MELVILYSDIFFFVFVTGCIVFGIWAYGKKYYREAFSRTAKNRWALFSFCVIIFYICIAFVDSIHYKVGLVEKDGNIRKDKNGAIIYGEHRSVFDRIVASVYSGIELNAKGVQTNLEKSYSSPFAETAFDKKKNKETGQWEYPPLEKPGAHVWGTDKAGGDVFYKLLKGIRTALIVGLITTMIVIPFAIFFGVTAGYFGGRIDDAIQFIYITLGSIPSILLISAMMIIVQAQFESGTHNVAYQDDKLVIFLCVILGVVGWAALCRLLRAETIKLKQLDYVSAARALGVSNAVIMIKYIIPNLIHVVLISSILRFSGLVMVEAILAYIKIGVPSTIQSWGRIVDGARSQLSRDPVIWWPVVGAFIMMFLLVFSINIFGDAVRDALDPRLRE